MRGQKASSRRRQGSLLLRCGSVSQGNLSDGSIRRASIPSKVKLEERPDRGLDVELDSQVSRTVPLT